MRRLDVMMVVSIGIGGLCTAFAQEPGTPEPPAPCVLTGSSDVSAENRPMLRLSDVSACDPRTYEILNSVFINGEPAVRLLPSPEGGTVPTGAMSVTVEDKPASRLGDGG